jgi:hypothetical protein
MPVGRIADWHQRPRTDAARRDARRKDAACLRPAHRCFVTKYESALDPPTGVSPTLARPGRLDSIAGSPPPTREEEPMPRPAQLEDQVLVVFKRALRERRRDVAEHLLHALEALCDNASPGTPLADAYLAAVGEQAPRRRRH